MGCRTSSQKRSFIRIVRSPDGRIEIDESGRAPGRGAYLCADGGCWPAALERNAIGRALKAPVPAELRARLAAVTRRTSPDARMTANEGDLIGQK